MKMKFSSLAMLALCASAQAWETMVPPGPLPTEIARPLLEQDPGVAAARAGLEVALREAGLLDSSPYEWTARATTQERVLSDGPHYGEWSIGIERTLRLPGKASADRNLGRTTIEASEAALQTLLLTRRQETAAMSALLMAQVASVKAYFGLMLDAHLIWDLEHEQAQE